MCSHLLGNLPDAPWRTTAFLPLHIAGNKCPYSVKLLVFIATLSFFSCIFLLSLICGYNYIVSTLKQAVYVLMQHHLAANIPFTLYNKNQGTCFRYITSIIVYHYILSGSHFFTFLSNSCSL